jgi:hypothetical protein
MVIKRSGGGSDSGGDNRLNGAAGDREFQWINLPD